MSGHDYVRCGDTDHCACYHDACCTCGSKQHGSCGRHPEVTRAVEHSGWCATCNSRTALAAGGIASSLKPIGEEGCTLYTPLRAPAVDDHVTLEFDTSPETLQRLREALQRTPDRP